MASGLRVMITAGGAGIGRATALACAASGAEVVLLDRVLRKLEAVYDEIVAAGGREPAIYPMDLEGATGPVEIDPFARERRLEGTAQHEVLGRARGQRASLRKEPDPIRRPEG